MWTEINSLATVINQTARDKGFWDKERNLGEMLMLAVSELSEALEEDRDGNPPVWFQHEETCLLWDSPFERVQNIRLNKPGTGLCSCIAKPEGALVEIVDCMIRCLDTAHDLSKQTHYTVGQVFDLKMEYNRSREHKHGKAY